MLINMMRYFRFFFLVIMIACIIYSVSIYKVGSGTFSFIIWLAGAAFFGAIFFFTGDGRWHRVPMALRRVSYAIILLLIILMTIFMGAMLSHFADKGVKDLDYIVVLGAQMRGHEPSTIFRYRLDAAYEYLMENPSTICIVSGGNGANEIVSEGCGGKEYLISKGITPERIIAETMALDTFSNIANSIDIISETTNDADIKLGIVTNNFHVFRGVHLAKNLTPSKVYGIAAYTVPWYIPNNMVRECFGIMKDFSKIKWL